MILALVIGLAVIVEYLVEGIKQMVPAIKVVSQERLVALGVALSVCLALPYIRIVDLGLLSRLSWLESVFLAAVLARGSSALHELLAKIGVVK